MKTLTNEQAQNYLKNRGSSCPFCGSDQIQGDSVEVHDGRVYQSVQCLKCGEGWHDGYTLDSVADDGGDVEFHYPPPPQFTVTVRGGVVQGVYASVDDAEVRIIDYDDDCDDPSEDREKQAEERINGVTPHVIY